MSLAIGIQNSIDQTVGWSDTSLQESFPGCVTFFVLSFSVIPFNLYSSLATEHLRPLFPRYFLLWVSK